MSNSGRKVGKFVQFQGGELLHIRHAIDLLGGQVWQVQRPKFLWQSKADFVQGRHFAV